MREAGRPPGGVPAPRFSLQDSHLRPLVLPEDVQHIGDGYKWPGPIFTPGTVVCALVVVNRSNSMSEGKPALFGIRNSNRDFSKQDSWSKNKFNSSFPASLIAYMDSIGLPCVYLKLDKHGNLAHERITALELFGMDPQDPSLYYSFESTYTPFQPISIGRPPTVDLMLMDAGSSKVLAGYEVKLTTLPDESTHKLTPAEYGCELVVRMPSIHFLACSLARKYAGAQNRLKEYFGRNGFGNASSYMEPGLCSRKLEGWF